MPRLTSRCSPPAKRRTPSSSPAPNASRRRRRRRAAAGEDATSPAPRPSTTGAPRQRGALLVRRQGRLKRGSEQATPNRPGRRRGCGWWLESKPLTLLFLLPFCFWKTPLKDLRFCLPFRQPAEPKRRRLHKLGEAASAVAETPAAGEPQQAVVPPAGEHRAEEVVEEVAPPPVQAAAPPMAQRRTEEVAEEAAPSSARAATPPAVENRMEGVIEEARTPQEGAGASNAPPPRAKKRVWMIAGE